MSVGRYDDQLKEKIIKLHLEKKQTIASLSEEYAISASSISRWIIVYRNKSAFNGRIKHTHQDCDK